MRLQILAVPVLWPSSPPALSYWGLLFGLCAFGHAPTITRARLRSWGVPLAPEYVRMLSTARTPWFARLEGRRYRGDHHFLAESLALKLTQSEAMRTYYKTTNPLLAARALLARGQHLYALASWQPVDVDALLA